MFLNMYVCGVEVLFLFLRKIIVFFILFLLLIIFEGNFDFSGRRFCFGIVSVFVLFFLGLLNIGLEMYF